MRSMNRPIGDSRPGRSTRTAHGSKERRRTIVSVVGIIIRLISPRHKNQIGRLPGRPCVKREEGLRGATVHHPWSA